MSETHNRASGGFTAGCAGNVVNPADTILDGGGTVQVLDLYNGNGGANCDADLRLLCFQTGIGGPLPALTPPAGSKKVFVTSTTHDGILGGLSGADTICQTRGKCGRLC
jgi:hypothetical protein